MTELEQLQEDKKIILEHLRQVNEHLRACLGFIDHIRENLETEGFDIDGELDHLYWQIAGRL